MDGVLFDSIPFARLVFIERHPGVTEEMYDEIHSGNFHEAAAKYAHLKADASEEEEARFKQEYSVRKGQSKMFEGVWEMLTELHDAGYVVVLNTNAYERNCLPLLENSGIKDFFSLIASAEMPRDKTEKFGIIQNKYGADIKDMVFVTDALGDVKDAEKAGVSTIAVTYGVHDEAHFKRGEHPFLVGVAHTVAELRELLSRWIGVS